mmetsp:Transcript_25090/g.36860  ORF Transcript_25090/g.36860 Transcript_25090/m.36860 type:complete len:292 (-) Transcript_25090:476-1351(-)
MAPHAHDVLCGRGGGTNRHAGNLHFRSLVKETKKNYLTSTKSGKSLIAKSILDAIRKQTPPGRFLEKNSKTGAWIEITPRQALRKTSQALREKAPEVRKDINSKETNRDPQHSTLGIVEQSGTSTPVKKDIAPSAEPTSHISTIIFKKNSVSIVPPSDKNIQKCRVGNRDLHRKQPVSAQELNGPLLYIPSTGKKRFTSKSSSSELFADLQDIRPEKYLKCEVPATLSSESSDVEGTACPLGGRISQTNDTKFNFDELGPSDISFFDFHNDDSLISVISRDSLGSPDYFLD